MKLKAALGAYFLIFILEGCCLMPEYGPLMNLKNLEDNRAQMNKDIEKKEGLYKKLELDLKDKRLQEGISRQEIIRRYGEPIFSRPVEGPLGAREALLYRHPTAYFSSDMVYLYLDDKENLVSWEIKPAPLAEEEKAGR